MGVSLSRWALHLRTGTDAPPELLGRIRDPLNVGTGVPQT